MICYRPRNDCVVLRKRLTNYIVEYVGPAVEDLEDGDEVFIDDADYRVIDSRNGIIIVREDDVIAVVERNGSAYEDAIDEPRESDR
jgi:hypothetical protein